MADRLTTHVQQADDIFDHLFSESDLVDQVSQDMQSSPDSLIHQMKWCAEPLSSSEFQCFE